MSNMSLHWQSSNKIRVILHSLEFYQGQSQSLYQNWLDLFYILNHWPILHMAKISMNLYNFILNFLICQISNIQVQRYDRIEAANIYFMPFQNISISNYLLKHNYVFMKMMYYLFTLFFEPSFTRFNLLEIYLKIIGFIIIAILYTIINYHPIIYLSILRKMQISFIHYYHNIYGYIFSKHFYLLFLVIFQIFSVCFGFL